MDETAEAEPGHDRADTTAATSEAELCLNCGTSLTGSYCSACGQKRRSPRIGFRDFLHEVVHELLHLDGKFVRTLRVLVTKPGQLTVEFVAGRRATYVSPLRLYLICSAVFFTLAISFPGAVVLKTGSGPPGKISLQPVESTPASKDAEADKTPEKQSKFFRDPRRVSETFLHDAAKGMFLLMPFFGLLLFVFYRKREPFYLPHLYFSVHYHSFVFLAMSILLLMKVPKITALNQLSRIAEFAILLYLYLSLRRVYGATRLGTVGRMISAGFIYIIALGATFLAILVFRVLQD